MSFEGLQERLAALQETTSQLKGLIDRLATLKFQPGSVPLGAEEENSVSGELSAEIGQTLRGGLEDQELLLEEVKYVRPEGQDKTRLQDDVERVGKELIRYGVRTESHANHLLTDVSVAVGSPFEEHDSPQRRAWKKRRN